MTTTLEKIRSEAETAMIDYIGPSKDREVYHTMIRIRMSRTILRLCKALEYSREQMNPPKDYDKQIQKILDGEE